MSYELIGVLLLGAGEVMIAAMLLRMERWRDQVDAALLHGVADIREALERLKPRETH